MLLSCFQETENEINQKLNRIKVFWPDFAWCLFGCQKWVIQWIQSAVGISQRNKSNSDNQAKCLSASFSHVTTMAKSDFCQQSSHQWSTFESDWRPVFKVKRKSRKFSHSKSTNALPEVTRKNFLLTLEEFTICFQVKQKLEKLRQ